MTRDEVAAMVTEFTAQVMKVDVTEVKPDTDLKNDLEADSLDVAEINVLLEERLAIAIGEERFKDLSTVDDIVGMVEQRVGASA